MYEMCEYLLQKGANPKNQDKKKLTPLIQAKRGGRDKICDLLIDFGADEKPKNISSNARSDLSVAHHKSAQSAVEAVSHKDKGKNEFTERYILSKVDE